MHRVSMPRVYRTLPMGVIAPEAFRVFSKGGIDGTLLMIVITPEILGVFNIGGIDGSRDKLGFGVDWDGERYESVWTQASYAPSGARSDTRKTEYMARADTRSGHRLLDLGRKRRS